MSGQNGFSSRSLDQEPDTIAAIPRDSDFIVIGTYSLVNESQGSGTSSRKGSLQVVPFSASTQLQPHTNISLERLDFSFGVYDIHFHPRYPDLLGVATSDARILFYFLSRRHEDMNSSKGYAFIKLGAVLVEGPDESSGQLSIITQFQFLDWHMQVTEDTTGSGRDNQRDILLAATTQSGNTKLLKVTVPYPTHTPSSDFGIEHALPQDTPNSSGAQILEVHKQSFDLEAWTVLPISYKNVTKQSYQHLLLLSGGDDSHLIISHLRLPYLRSSEIDLDMFDTNLLLTVKKAHQAGVVSICNLGPVQPLSWNQPHPENNSCARQWLILTGSYDETLRLFILGINHTDQDLPEPMLSTRSFRLQAELNLGGGVWRIKLLDCYPTQVSSPLNASSSINGSRVTAIDYILLIAGHTSGAHIVRLTITEPTTFNDELKCEFRIEKSFTEGHESLVYAVEARHAVPLGETDNGQTDNARRWEIISASFYDKKVCNWEWMDDRFNDS
ncbi:hypothetical protein H2198_000890 [Neophaeococcomyces mojaviensis]|uniref:Uncharacterized protein n=1 Tax=Neophaeococcomyces mojaviensis TaxID=3383035 RepID=A0ACC3AIR1_9EURO|nr:hypothetical protein H2198_000890 [Knufia sp. JES_112]